MELAARARGQHAWELRQLQRAPGGRSALLAACGRNDGEEGRGHLARAVHVAQVHHELNFSPDTLAVAEAYSSASLKGSHCGEAQTGQATWFLHSHATHANDSLSDVSGISANVLQ